MRTICSFVLIAGCVAGASAGIPIYTDEASFLNDLITPGVTEGYESYAVDIVNGARTISLNRFEVTYDGPASFGVSNTVNPGAGVAPVADAQHLRSTFGGGGPVTVTFSFDSPIEAFGTYYTDLELAPLRIEVFLDNGQSFIAGDFDAPGNGGVRYFGLQPIEAGITSVTFTMFSQNLVDDVYFDQTTVTVPTPAASLLLTMGLLSTRRRR